MTNNPIHLWVRKCVCVRARSRWDLLKWIYFVHKNTSVLPKIHLRFASPQKSEYASVWRYICVVFWSIYLCLFFLLIPSFHVSIDSACNSKSKQMIRIDLKCLFFSLVLSLEKFMINDIFSNEYRLTWIYVKINHIFDLQKWMQKLRVHAFVCWNVGLCACAYIYIWAKDTEPHKF